MTRTRIFRSNKTQAVRLAKAVEFPEHVEQVEVVCIGTARLVAPEGESWDSFFDGPRVSADFLVERDQPEPQERGSS